MVLIRSPLHSDLKNSIEERRKAPLEEITSALGH